MNVRPKFQCFNVYLFLFQNLFSIHLIAQFLNLYGTKKIHRKGILQKNKEMGGLALRNFLFYYRAANI